MVFKEKTQLLVFPTNGLVEVHQHRIQEGCDVFVGHHLNSKVIRRRPTLASKPLGSQASTTCSSLALEKKKQACKKPSKLENKLMCYPQQLRRSWKDFGHLARNLLEPHQPSAPEPSGTSSAICTGTLRNLISHLHRNPLEPHQPSAPEPSGTHQNPPEPSPEPAVAAAPDRTRAKDPIASFAVGGKKKHLNVESWKTIDENKLFSSFPTFA